MGLTLTQLIEIAWCVIAINPLFANKWLCDETAYRLLLAGFPTFESDERITRALVVKALNNRSGAYDSSNTNKIYHAEFQHECPYNTTVTRRKVHYYYNETNGETPTRPAEPSECHDVYAKSSEMVEGRIRVSRNKENADKVKDVEEKFRAIVTARLVKEARKKAKEAAAKVKQKNVGGGAGSTEDGQSSGPTSIVLLTNEKMTTRKTLTGVLLKQRCFSWAQRKLTMM